MSFCVVEYATRQEFVQAIVTRTVSALRSGIDRKGHATLVLSGGRTPEMYLPLLFQADIDWSSVNITLSDERWVPATDANSNEKMVRSCMSGTRANDAVFVPLYGGEPGPVLGLDAAEARIASMPHPFDIAMLGMGPDGHFASLFPGLPGMDGGKGQCTAVNDAPICPRMSLSASLLLSVERIFLIVTGDEKRAVLDAAMDNALVESALPVAMLAGHSGLTVIHGPG